MRATVLDNGLIVDQKTNTYYGYIFNFREHGSFSPNGKVGEFTDEQIDAHNRVLADHEWQCMLRRGQGLLYWDGKTVSDWTRSHRVTPTRSKTSFHNMAGRNGRTDVWFNLDGNVWHGVHIGDNQVLRVRRTKDRQMI